MKYYFINTDAAARKNVRTCDIWFEYQMAFSGGPWEKYGLPFRSLEPYDVCLMYHNKVGLVGAGRVLEKWDEQSYSEKHIYMDYPFPEYRLSVDWYIDICTNPIDTMIEFGYVPRGFLKPIIQYREIAEGLIKRLESQVEFRGPDELYLPSNLQEGKVRSVPVDIYERNPVARKLCIEYWGAECNVCKFTFSKFYGPVGEGLIHVHHLTPISLTSGTRQVDPKNDLRPVCPNCHAILHKKCPPYSIEDVKNFIEKNHSAG